MKTIIVATDFSAEAKNAAAYAAAAAQVLGARIIFFSLQNISIHTLNARLPGSSFDNIISKCYEMVAIAARDLSYKHNIEVLPDMASGDFFEELIRCHTQHKADLIVMGMAAKSLEQDLLGNTTTKVMDKLNVPVLAVPLNAKFTNVKRIVFACDVMRGIHTKVLIQVRMFAKIFGSSVEVFHVRDHVYALKERASEETNLEIIKDQLKGIQYFYHGIESKKIIGAIRNEIEATGADLLVMVTHRYGFWNSLVHRSKTREMAAGSNIPLLSLPI